MEGETVPLTVNAIYADGSKTVETSTATVIVTGAAYASGKITAGSVGTGLITATYSGITKVMPFKVTEFLPRAGMIMVGGKRIDNFSKDKFSYSFSDYTSVPVVTVVLPSSRLTYTVTPSTTVPGTTEVIVKDAADPNKEFATYKINFRSSPDSSILCRWQNERQLEGRKRRFKMAPRKGQGSCSSNVHSWGVPQHCPRFRATAKLKPKQ